MDELSEDSLENIIKKLGEELKEKDLIITSNKEKIQELEATNIKLKIRLADKVMENDDMFHNTLRSPSYSEVTRNQF